LCCVVLCCVVLCCVVLYCIVLYCVVLCCVVLCCVVLCCVVLCCVVLCCVVLCCVVLCCVVLQHNANPDKTKYNSNIVVQTESRTWGRTPLTYSKTNSGQDRELNMGQDPSHLGPLFEARVTW
jgi:hypothetical protein